MGQIEELLFKLSHNSSELQSVPVSAEDRVQNQTATTLLPFGFVLVFNSIH